MKDFMFWLFLLGIIVATMQDLKRREVDNWLNLLLITVSFAFFSFSAILSEQYDSLYHLLFMMGCMFILAHLCYHGRVFAGGDAKLLFAMTVFFIGATVYESLLNVGVFLFLLMVSGSVYGLGYSLYLYTRDYAKINRWIKKEGLWNAKLCFSIGIIFLVGGIWSVYLFVFAGIIMILPLLYSFAKGIETNSLVRTVQGKDLREGDWLVEDMKVGKKIIVASWDGLSKKEITLMKRLRKVRIKEGIPFVPAFLLAFILYILSRETILRIVGL